VTETHHCACQKHQKKPAPLNHFPEHELQNKKTNLQKKRNSKTVLKII